MGSHCFLEMMTSINFLWCFSNSNTHIKISGLNFITGARIMGFKFPQEKQKLIRKSLKGMIQTLMRKKLLGACFLLILIYDLPLQKSSIIHTLILLDINLKLNKSKENYKGHSLQSKNLKKEELLAQKHLKHFQQPQVKKINQSIPLKKRRKSWLGSHTGNRLHLSQSQRQQIIIVSAFQIEVKEKIVKNLQKLQYDIKKLKQPLISTSAVRRKVEINYLVQVQKKTFVLEVQEERKYLTVLEENQRQSMSFDSKTRIMYEQCNIKSFNHHWKYLQWQKIQFFLFHSFLPTVLILLVYTQKSSIRYLYYYPFIRNFDFYFLRSFLSICAFDLNEFRI